MSIANFKTRMGQRELLVGTFVKTASHEVIELLAMSGLDFVCLDAEHAPFDRQRLDVCLAMSRALDFPTLVRVTSGEAPAILNALDCGATGVVIPHVDSVEKAEQVAKWSRFGHGGRGYAGSSRWAGFATRKAEDILAQSQSETVVIAQIEEPEGVDAADDIAAVPGVDGLFVGPADLAVCYGTTDQSSTVVRNAIKTVGSATQQKSIACATFVPNASSRDELVALGVSMFLVASEHAFMLSGAKHTAATFNS